MIDIHTHILPEIDDGSKNLDMSIDMLNMEYSQGVNTVVLTPHFYRSKEEISNFLLRRKNSYESLTSYISNLPLKKQKNIPKLVLGSEVLWVPNMISWDNIESLCIGSSRYMLLELPTSPWQSSMLNQIYDLMNKKSIVPIIAHLERYLKLQNKDFINEIISMGTPIQLSSSAFLSFFSAYKMCNMIKKHTDFIVASDCHNTDYRKPNLLSGISVIEKKLGKSTADMIVNNANIIFDI